MIPQFRKWKEQFEGRLSLVFVSSGSAVSNVTRNVTLNGRPTPPGLLDLLKAGGIYPLLEKEGLIAPKSEGESRKEKV